MGYDFYKMWTARDIIKARVGSFGQYSIITNKFMTYRARRIKKRSLKERLFSLPWRPLVSRKVVVIDAPRRRFIIDNNTNSIYCHPEMYEKICDTIENK